MKIDSSIAGINPINQTIKPLGSAPAAEGGGQTSFADILKGQLGEVQRLNDEAGVLQQRMLSGDGVDLNEVALAVQKADLALTFAMQLRNKVVEAYQEINRMQV
jgi:flagellar hook-basal body complex protein FliE